MSAVPSTATLIATIGACTALAAVSAAPGHRRRAARDVLAGGLALGLLSVLVVIAAAAVTIAAAYVATAR